VNSPVSAKEIQAAARAEIERRKRLVAQKAEAERDFYAFVKLFWHILEPETPLIDGWVLRTICDTLMAVTDGHLKRVIINVFPGAMKSLLLNVFWPAWEWGPCRMPWLRYISASYSASLTERDNTRFRRLVSDPLYRKLWGDVFECDRDSIVIVENNKTGWKMALSVGSGTTGFRGDRILIDDANNPFTVESDVVRENTNLWLREVMPDRLNNLDEGAIINIQQRTHQRDATAVLAEAWEDFAWVCIPMRFDPLRISRAVLRWEDDGTPLETWVDPRALDEDGNELEGLFTDEKGNLKVRMGSPMARAEGELAWPERFSPQAVDEQERIKQAYAFQSQYQQAPTVRAGEIIRRDWWQLWADRDFPDMGTVVASLDTAVEEREQNDWNALTIWGAFPGPVGEPKIMLKWAWRGKMPLSQLVARVAEFCTEHKVDYLLIEHKTRGRDVHDEIVRLYLNATWQTILVKVEGDKESRLRAVSGLFAGDVRKDPVTGMDVWSNGMIFAPDTAWADEVIDEVSAFPRGAHDDYVDSLSQGLGWMRKRGVVLRKVEYDDQETEKRRYRRTPSVPYAITSKG